MNGTARARDARARGALAGAHTRELRQDLNLHSRCCDYWLLGHGTCWVRSHTKGGSRGQQRPVESHAETAKNSIADGRGEGACGACGA